MCTSNLLKVSERTKTVLPNLSRTMGVLCVMLAMFAGAAVGALDAPQGPVVLKLSGLIEAHNQSKVAVLNMHKTYYERSIWQLKAIEVE